MPAPRMSAARLAAGLLAAMLVLLAAGLAAGSEGWSLAWADEWPLVSEIRAPRTVGALFAGALLGLAGALAQGLFRNPLADPYLLGSASGAGLGVVLVLAAGGLLGVTIGMASVGWLLRLGLVGAAFVGALAGVSLTLMLSRGAGQPLQLLLSGVVVGVLLGAVADLVMLVSPEALRGKQVFLLGTTSFLGWPSVGMLAGALAVGLPLAQRFARALDALVLGEASASSLGLNLPQVRLLLVVLMALATGTAVAQAGLVAFVGLVSPHLVRRCVVVTHGGLLALSALSGGVLLLAADVAARSVIAPQELPVGVLTAVVGGCYLMLLLRRRAGG
ncbi:iron ABC transporter permease [Aquincola sp. MAHUQ-54]|uniref:Iron ABC transporter permease n=2 Tax=Sphaerotilaceae TaxID=2975441 RepID=A0AAW9QED5_9BURK